MGTHEREYAAMAREVSGCAGTDDRVTCTIDVLWSHLRSTGVSWLGIYVDHPDQADDRRLVLGPCRDKPACSPIGLHGACGRALLSRSILIVHDVAELGAHYIACDPRDRSEIVIPLMDDAGRCWGVLDVDSWDVGSFSQRDADGLQQVLIAAGLTSAAPNEQRPDQ